MSIFASQIDNSGMTSFFSIQLQARTAGGLFDSADATLFYLDDVGTAIESAFFADDFDNQWDLFTDSRIVPVGTRSLRVFLNTIRSGGSSSDGFFDEVSLTVVPEPGMAICAFGIAALTLARRRSRR